MMTEKYYMNVCSGSVGAYEEWYYENSEGKTVNAVDLGEVAAVMKIKGEWVEV